MINSNGQESILIKVPTLCPRTVPKAVLVTALPLAGTKHYSEFFWKAQVLKCKLPAF